MKSGNNNRLRTGFISSIVFHIVVFTFIGLLGFFSTTAPPDQSAEVSIIGGNGGGGGGGGGHNDQNIQALPTQAKSESKQIAQKTENPAAIANQDDIDALENDEKQIPQPNYMQQNSGVPSSGSDNSSGSGAGSGSGGGNGSGSGTGTGSGTGAGSGSGSGGGNGSGTGTGNGSGDGSGDGGNIAAVPPRVVSRTQPVYPRAARQQGIEGTVHMRLLVNSNGVVSEALVTDSSGNEELDAAAAAAAEKWQFIPAQNGFGQDIDCYANVAITFNLYQ